MKRNVLITLAIGDDDNGGTLGVAYAKVAVPDDLLTRYDPDKQQDWYLETIKIIATSAYRDAFSPVPTPEEILMMDAHVADVERRRAAGEAP